MKTDEEIARDEFKVYASQISDIALRGVRAGRLAELRWVKDFLLYRGDIAQHERIDNRIAQLEGSDAKS